MEPIKLEGEVKKKYLSGLVRALKSCSDMMESNVLSIIKDYLSIFDLCCGDVLISNTGFPAATKYLEINQEKLMMGKTLKAMSKASGIRITKKTRNEFFEEAFKHIKDIVKEKLYMGNDFFMEEQNMYKRLHYLSAINKHFNFDNNEVGGFVQEPLQEVDDNNYRSYFGFDTIRSLFLRYSIGYPKITAHIRIAKRLSKLIPLEPSAIYNDSKLQKMTIPIEVKLVTFGPFITKYNAECAKHLSEEIHQCLTNGAFMLNVRDEKVDVNGYEAHDHYFCSTDIYSLLSEKIQDKNITLYQIKS